MAEWKVFCTVDAERKVISVSGPFDEQQRVIAHIHKVVPTAEDISVYGPLDSSEIDRGLPEGRSLDEQLSLSVDPRKEIVRLLKVQVRNAQRLMQRSRAIDAHRSFNTWVDDVANILEHDFDTGSSVASWLALPTSRLVRNDGYHEDAITWQHFNNTIKKRMEWLANKIGVLSTLSELHKNLAEGKMSTENGGPKAFGIDPKRVFIVYGRNLLAYSATIQFLASLRLNVRTFEEIKSEIGGSPYIGDIVKRGLSQAKAIVVLITPDERATLQEQFVSGSDKQSDIERLQPRPNVLLEAGMALAIDENRTILVVLGNAELPSDLGGRHLIRMNNSPTARQKFKSALKGAGCEIEEAEHWLDEKVAGDFDRAISP